MAFATLAVCGLDFPLLQSPHHGERERRKNSAAKSLHLPPGEEPGRLGSGLPPPRRAEVPPSSTEFTQGVSCPGAQFLKSDASTGSATPAWVSLRHSTGRGEGEQALRPG